MPEIIGSFSCRHRHHIRRYFKRQKHYFFIAGDALPRCYTLIYGLRIAIWPRKALQLAKISKSTDSGRWCRHYVRHGLLSPIWCKKRWIGSQMKALTEPFKMLVRVTGLNYLIGDEFQFASPHAAAVRNWTSKSGHLARHLEVSLNLLTIIDILNKSPHQFLQYSRTNFNL